MKTQGFDYKEVASVPAKVREGRWDVPLAFGGQMVTRAFAASGKYEAGPGARYMRVSDASDGTVRYYRIRKA